MIGWRREALKEEALDDLFFKGRQRAIVSQTNIGTVSKATLGKLLRDGVERIRALSLSLSLSERIDTLLN